MTEKIRTLLRHEQVPPAAWLQPWRTGASSVWSPDADHPNRGICIKGQAAPELVYDPERLRYPLRRTNSQERSRPALGASGLGRGHGGNRRAG